MHKLFLLLFKFLYNLGNLSNLVFSFFIIAISLSWLENIFNATWTWLDFIKPSINFVIDFTNGMISIPAGMLGMNFNSGYLISIIILIALICAFKYLLSRLQDLREAYDDLHIAVKKSSEKSFNKKLVKNIEKEQKQILKYMVLINTKLKKKFSHKEININVDEQNKSLNEFIVAKTGVQYQNFNGGFLYYFDDFNKIDHVLTTLFKLLEPSKPLDCAICIQIGVDLKQIKNLAELENFGKIIISADTLFRYKHNSSHMFETECMGVYQKPEGTLEVHEFHKIII